MEKKLFLKIFLFCLTIIFTSKGEDLNYKIAVPEYICDKDGQIKEIDKDVTSIRLLGNDASSLKFKFNVNYKRIGGGCRNQQRCSLIAWKIVREFENYLKNYPGIENGLIEFNNTMLMPGLQYVLNIVVESNGKIIENKQMNLDFVDEDVKKNVQKPMASVLLLGSGTAFAYSTYTLNAETTICSNITDFYFTWKLFDNSNEELEIFQTKSSELEIPPNTFQGSKIYNINCELMDASNDAPLAKGTQMVKVMENGIQLSLPFKTIMTKMKEPIVITAYTVDLDNQDGEIKVTWTCTDDKGEDCNVNSDTNELNIESGFATTGTFKLSVKASKDKFVETAECEITIMEDAPIIQVDSFETPVNPSSGVEIFLNINDLKAFCSLQWTVVNENGYESLDLNTVPGNIGEPYNITLREDIFLNELEEFSNSTVNKKISLLIPPPEGSWQGLQGDSKYLFRLIISCPQIQEDFDIIDDNTTEYITEPIMGEPIITTADILIETNGGPILKPLDISPQEGKALLTTFNFKTQLAEDKPQHKPVLYKFGFVVKQRYLIFCTMSDVINTNTILPYLSDGVQTFLEGCDNFNSCNRILGPIIKTGSSNQKEIQSILPTIKKYLITNDYNKAFIFILSVISTYKEQNEDAGLEEATNYFSNEINQEILDQINAETKDDYWDKTSNNLIKYISDFNDDLSPSEEVLNNLVNLRNEISQRSNQKENLLLPKRKLLSKAASNTNTKTDNILNELKNYLDVSEMIITTNSQSTVKVESEKEVLRKTLRTFMEKLCVSLYNKYQKIQIEMKTVLASVQKFDNNLNTIPFSRNSLKSSAKIKLNGNNKMSSNNKLCLGKAMFMNYLEKTGTIYYTEVFNGDENSENNIMDNFGATVFLPINSTEINGKSPMCIVWNNEWKRNCRLVKIIQQFAQCSCDSVGYYFLEYETITVTTTLSFSISTTNSPESVSTASNTITPIISTKLTTQAELTAAPPSSLTESNSTSKNNFTTEFNNETHAQLTQTTDGNYQILSYVLIGLSIFGVAFLCIVLRRLSGQDEDQNILLDDFDTPKYAALHNEELLTGSL